MSGANEEGSPVAGATPQEQTKTDDAILRETAAERKAFLTLHARAALCGCELHALSGGGYILSRWGLHRELRDLAAVEAMLAQMGGAR